MAYILKNGKLCPTNINPIIKDYSFIDDVKDKDNSETDPLNSNENNGDVENEDDMPILIVVSEKYVYILINQINFNNF